VPRPHRSTGPASVGQVTVLLLIRHAHTDTAGRRLTGWSRGVHLNERGRREAAGLVLRLDGVPVHAIVSSPLERCRETAAPLARDRGLSVSARRGLLETDFGDWTGRTISSVRRTKLWRLVQHAPSAIRFPGGESLLDVQARAVAEIELIAASYPRRTVVVVSHADPIRLLVAHVTGMHADHLERVAIDPASITVVATSDGVARLIKLNDTGGLDALRPRRRPGPKVRG
jgi:probable phosphomutase (TIGR03848 family)